MKFVILFCFSNLIILFKYKLGVRKAIDPKNTHITILNYVFINEQHVLL